MFHEKFGQSSLPTEHNTLDGRTSLNPEIPITTPDIDHTQKPLNNAEQTTNPVSVKIPEPQIDKGESREDTYNQFRKIIKTKKIKKKGFKIT